MPGIGPFRGRAPARGSVLLVLAEHAVDRALDGVAGVLELVLGVGLALLGLALGLGLLVAGQLAEALLGLAAQLVLAVLELLVGAHRGPPRSSGRTGAVRCLEPTRRPCAPSDPPVDRPWPDLTGPARSAVSALRRAPCPPAAARAGGAA